MWLTLLTSVIWFGVMLIYYGMMLLSTQLLLLEQEGEHCPEIYYYPSVGNITLPKVLSSDCVHLTESDYKDALYNAMGEIPGVLVTYFLLETFGRKITLASETLALAGVLFVLWFCFDPFPQAVFLFVARGISAGALQAIQLFTSEVL